MLKGIKGSSVLNALKQEQIKKPILKVSWLIMLIASMAYVGSEWLFLVTKPSSISSVSAIEKILMLGFSISLLTLIGCIVQLLLYLPLQFIRKKNAFLVKILAIIPAIIITITILLLIDNFTYTTMGFGIITSKGVIRILLLLALVFIFIFLIIRLSKLHERISLALSKQKKKNINIFFIILVELILINVIAVFILGMKNKSTSIFSNPTSKKRTNIVLITADGLNSENMSVYGYEKETTPFLKSIASKMFIAQNNFSNSSSTTGSLVSILTSKHPTNTRVLYRPDILRNEDSYQSLPAILKSMGYYSAQYSFGYYADAFAVNMKNAFDYANGRNATATRILGFEQLPVSTNYEYFLYELQNRLVSRLSHILMIKEMENEYQQVAKISAESEEFKDREKMEHAANILLQAEQPVFLHIHWMKTHGEYFCPRNRVFSEGIAYDQQGNWNPLFYEDTIRDFDEDFAFLYTELEKADLLKETVFIIGSDHGSEFVTYKRIPLLFLFPNAENAKRVAVDTQNIDIAPTILDFLGVEIPEWMEGDTLLSELTEYRPIFGVQNLNKTRVEGEGWVTNDAYNNAPYYQFDVIGVQNCGIWTELNLETYQWSQISISAYDQQCRPQDVLRAEEIRNNIIERLKKDRFVFDETLIPLP